MKRIVSILLLISLIISFSGCSSQQVDMVQAPSPQQQEASIAPAPVETAAPTPTPEPAPYTPMDLFGIEFNPYAEMQLPDIFTILSASFSKGSEKMEGKSPFLLSISAEGNMYAAVAYMADVSGLSEQEKNDRFDEYSKNGITEFIGADGSIVTIRQQKPHDDKHENGACLIQLTYHVPDAELEKYTVLIRDNYNMSALASVKDLIKIETDFAECSIEVNLQINEAVIGVQYYVDDAEAARQRIAEIPQSEWREWYGLPSAVIPYGLIKNTLVFDNRFGAAILVLQSSNELNSPLSDYVEPEFSLTKFGFGFDSAGTCGVYEQHEPHYMNVAIHRPEWGSFNEDWNIEYLDQVNGHGLRITYLLSEDKYHISIDSNTEGAAFDYFPATKEYTGQYPDPDTLTRMFNDAFGTQGEDFYDKPLAYFEQLVQERFGMSIDELYALPKQ